ncbi:MAG: Arc family DNA-binding protein [Methylococcales bacterium]
MANLSIRKLDEEVFSRLRIMATTHGISMEEEVRQILKQALTQQVKLGDMALQLFGEAQGVDLELSEYTAH